VHLYSVVCCSGNAELAELELKAELRSQLKMERCVIPYLPTPLSGQYLAALFPDKITILGVWF
jgi:hypothetical protein